MPEDKTHSFRPEEAPSRTGSGYPPPHDATAPNRVKFEVGDRAGLTQFGVNVTTLMPGEQSALRHWHTSEDEFVYVIEGTLALVTDDGEEVMTPGMCAGFPAGVANGHHLINRSGSPARFIEVGTRAERDDCTYPDADLHGTAERGRYVFTRKDGSPA